jgi:ribosome-associated translation inhibitor RaiA
MPGSNIFEHRIRELARRLEKFSSRIANCHIVIEKPHQSATQGGLFDVHITLTVPNNVIVVRRAHSTDPRHSDAYIALRDAFSAAKRKLQEHERMARGELKSHAAPPAQEAQESISA